MSDKANKRKKQVKTNEESFLADFFSVGKEIREINSVNFAQAKPRFCAARHNLPKPFGLLLDKANKRKKQVKTNEESFLADFFSAGKEIREINSMP